MQIWSTNSGWFQIFRYVEEQFVNIRNKKCLDVHGGKDEEGRKVIVWNKHNGANQRWTVVYVDQAAKIKSTGLVKDFGWHANRPFYMVSRLPFHRVAETIGANNITIKRWRKGAAAQQFWFNPTSKLIYSNHWKNYCMEVQSSGTNKNLRMTSSCYSRWWNLFRFEGGLIVNDHGKAIDVDGGLDSENRNIIVWNKHGKKNQLWDIVYADDYPEEPTKGDLNKNFGLYVEREFVIISELKAHRQLTIIDGRNFAIKTANGMKQQIWWFDQKSKTIKSKYNNQSFDIKNNGKSNTMQIWTTNSNWFQIFKYTGGYKMEKIVDEIDEKDSKPLKVGTSPMEKADDKLDKTVDPKPTTKSPVEIEEE